MMESKNIQNNVANKDSFDPLNRVNLCDVSKASVEIMLDRFCNGKEIDFPFSQ